MDKHAQTFTPEEEHLLKWVVQSIEHSVVMDQPGMRNDPRVQKILQAAEMDSYGTLTGAELEYLVDVMSDNRDALLDAAHTEGEDWEALEKVMQRLIDTFSDTQKRKWWKFWKGAALSTNYSRSRRRKMLVPKPSKAKLRH